MLFDKLSSWFKSSIRVLLIAMVCGLVFVSNAYPAQATPSKATEGEASLNRIQAKTDAAANPDASPRGIEEITKEAQKGSNAVQGGADTDKMVKPEDTDATTVKEKAANFLENLTN
jgi:hypothetical protein